MGYIRRNEASQMLSLDFGHFGPILNMDYGHIGPIMGISDLFWAYSGGSEAGFWSFWTNFGIFGLFWTYFGGSEPGFKQFWT